jgi:peptidoglycan/LPS O-acetylase OafA/YrhL
VEKRDNLIDYARLGLALSVCMVHLALHGYFKRSPAYNPTWAVPGFLCISGFYVLRSYERSASWADFAVRRCLRIFPAFAVSLALSTLLGGWSTIAPTLLFYVTAGNVVSGPVYNGIVWSLGAEEIAYIALALLFTIGAYKAVWPIWLAFALSCVVSTYFCGRSDQIIMRQAEIVPAFFAGSLFYIYRARVLSPYVGAALVAIALISSVKICGSGDPHLFSLKWTAGVELGVGILILRKIKMPKIPDISYSIYIYHIPLLIALKATLPVFFASLTAFCFASWFFIEKPALKLKDRRPRPVQPTPELAEVPT